MTINQEYNGFYFMMGFAFVVQDNEGQLMAAMPGVPVGYEVSLIPVGMDRFKMQGGPLSGGTVTFGRDQTGEVIAMGAGGFELAKVPQETAEALPVVERLLAPDLELTPEKEAAFHALLQTILDDADGGWVDYSLPYPNHEFIQYVSLQDIIIFHGSNNPAIAAFAPVRKSIELHDETGRGNLQAVYGTHDGLWAMFFAVVDRAKLRGSIRNGVLYFHNQEGNSLPVYNFSVNQEQLADKPWTDGALYLLPRATFVRLTLIENVFANEWASEKEVRPLAKLRVQPEDFPFLDQISGHDDGELLQLETLGKLIRAGAVRATLQDAEFSVTLPVAMRPQLDEYIRLQQAMIPTALFLVTHSDAEITLKISALPPAYRHVIGEEYTDLLTE